MKRILHCYQVLYSHQEARIMLAIAIYIIIFINSLLIETKCYALSLPDIEIEPPVRIIRINSEIKDVLIEAHFNGHIDANLKFEWSIDGPGSLDGDRTQAAIFYVVPRSIKEKTAQVTIRLKVNNDGGEEASKTIKFGLIALDIDPITTQNTKKSLNILGTENSNQLIINQLIEEGDLYFDQQLFIASSRKRDAFTVYKEILNLEPLNLLARRKIYEMAEIYQRSLYSACEQKEYDNIQDFYQKYLMIANYISDIFQDQNIKSELMNVQNVLKNSNSSMMAGQSSTTQQLRGFKLEALQYLRENLYKDIQEYEKLKEEKAQRDIQITKLMDIVDNLRNLESLYTEFAKGLSEIEQGMKGIKDKRIYYEKELSELLGSS